MDDGATDAHRWALLGPPLRPSPQDTAVVRAAIEDYAKGRKVEMLVLGMTPELLRLRLPAGSNVTAVDRDRAMVDLLFTAAPGRTAWISDWRNMPLSSASMSIAAGDGCATLLAFPDGHRDFFAELRRVLRPDGLLILRLFAAPDVPETLDDVRAALPSIKSFHALEWRIAMAIQTDQRAVPATSILQAFNVLVPDRAALAQRSGWSREMIDHIDTYRSSPAVYSFPTVSEIRSLLAPAFTEVACHVPTYELGDRCPTFILRRPAS